MNYKILHLSLREKPFEVMVSGEKRVEFRKPSVWMKSRLYNKDGTRKEYDAVKFTNGYGKDKPSFTAIYNGFATCLETTGKHYSNGLDVLVEQGDIQIYLGDILKKENIK